MQSIKHSPNWKKNTRQLVWFGLASVCMPGQVCLTGESDRMCSWNRSIKLDWALFDNLKLIQWHSPFQGMTDIYEHRFKAFYYSRRWYKKYCASLLSSYGDTNLTSPQESSGLDTAAGHEWENLLNVLIPTKKEAYCSVPLGILQLCWRNKEDHFNQAISSLFPVYFHLLILYNNKCLHVPCREWTIWTNSQLQLQQVSKCLWTLLVSVL